ncbi:MAG: ferritin-like domain-containing protein [Acidobacteriaceae bacterium]
MTEDGNKIANKTNRRSFLKKGAFAAGAVTAGAGLLGNALPAFSQERRAGASLIPGDAAILRFLAAIEMIEMDLWIQYAELGGFQNTTDVPGLTGGNPLYTAALTILDSDMPQYITDNTDDEISHQAFINAYLVSRGAAPVDLSPFATIPGSTATGSSGKKRLTNLMQLNVDTSFWTRYRIDNENPDLDPNFVFPQAVVIKNRTAIPRSDADTAGSTIDEPTDHLKAIAFTAGFHFAFIEQGGTSLYPSLAQRVSDPEVLRILLSIGPTETMHFQTWQDKAGNATPVHDVDPITGAAVTFVDLKTNQPESLQANLIMPEPTDFLSRSFPRCSIIRSTETNKAARGAALALFNDGLFTGQRDPRFFSLLSSLAEAADAATRS